MGVWDGEGREAREEAVENDLTPPHLHPHLAEMQPKNKQGQETPVIAYTFFNVSENERSLEMKNERERERKKNPCRLYFFHLNCKTSVWL